MARETVESLCQKAQHALSEGNNDEAMDFYKKALAMRSDHPDAHYGLATVYFLQGDLATSAHHFKEVTRYDSTKAGAYINLGAVYNRLERYDEAIAALRKGISLDHNRAEGYYNLGLVYRKLGQFDMAIHAYREATRVNPRMPDAHYNIANIYLERGLFGQAVGHYKAALEIRPNWEKALRGLENAENLLEAQETQEQSAKAPKAAKSDTGAQMANPQDATPLDPERLVDPQVHGELLRALHRATVDTDTIGRDLLTTLTQAMEPAIKELSTTLLYPDSSAGEIEHQVRRFEDAINSMCTLEDNLQANVEKVRMLGDQLVKS